jgi:HEAT repeat protein
MKNIILIVSFCAALGCVLLPGCSESKSSKVQSGHDATRDEIHSTSADDWFDRIGEKEAALGYAPNTSLYALIQKAKESDAVRDDIISKATQIVGDSTQDSYRRWQCCYVLSGIGDERSIPTLKQALNNDESTTVRGVAACALGAFDNSAARDALQEAAKNEKNPDVQAWIQKALDGQFLPKK